MGPEPNCGQFALQAPTARRMVAFEILRMDSDAISADAKAIPSRLARLTIRCSAGDGQSGKGLAGQVYQNVGHVEHHTKHEAGAA